MGIWGKEAEENVAREIVAPAIVLPVSTHQSSWLHILASEVVVKNTSSADGPQRTA